MTEPSATAFPCHVLRLRVTAQTQTRAAGCCVTARGFSCILSIFSMLPEGLDRLGAVRDPAGFNPIGAKCSVQLILLFYLSHEELPWKMNCKSLSGELTTSISSAVFDTTQRASPPALQYPAAAPNAGEPSPSSHQQRRCQRGSFADNLVHVYTNQKRI